MDIFVVGGSVRDQFMNREVNDVDRVVVGATEEDFLQEYPDAQRVGRAFPVYLVNGEEYAFARSDAKDSKDIAERVVNCDPSVTLKDDLFRRDLTVNAMALDSSGNVVDPFCGLQDIELKVLRHVSSAFADDPLRVFRVARFASTLGFEVAPETIIMMRSLKSRLPALSGERVFKEMRKALGGQFPRKFFDVLKEADILDYWFKPLFDLIGVLQPEKWHPEGDAYEHTMLVVEKVSGEEARFAALCHDFGKALTPKENWPKHYGHDKAAESIIIQWCEKLKVPFALEKKTKIVAKLHMKAKSVSKPGKIIQLAIETKTGWNELKQVMIADAMIPENNEETVKSISKIELAFNVMKKITGQHVKDKWPEASGPLFAERLMELRINEMTRLFDQ